MNFASCPFANSWLPSCQNLCLILLGFVCSLILAHDFEHPPHTYYPSWHISNLVRGSVHACLLSFASPLFQCWYAYFVSINRDPGSSWHVEEAAGVAAGGGELPLKSVGLTLLTRSKGGPKVIIAPIPRPFRGKAGQRGGLPGDQRSIRPQFQCHPRLGPSSLCWHAPRMLPNANYWAPSTESLWAKLSEQFCQKIW